ncbi:hypothetical protein HK096_008915, partial [Nowakowskiella sp. JEL0078]
MSNNNQFEQNSFIPHPVTPTSAYESSQPSPYLSHDLSNPNSVAISLTPSSSAQNTVVPSYIPVQQSNFNQKANPSVETQQIFQDYSTQVTHNTSKNQLQANAPNRRRRTFIILGILGLVIVVGAVLGGLFGSGVIGKTVIIASIQSANTKQSWMTSISSDFNNKGISIDGGVANVNITYGGSNITSNKPDGWSPQNFLWVQQLETQYANSGGLFSGGTEDCKSIAVTPVGIAMWKPMAEALGWPNAKIGWKDIVNLAGNQTGWSTYGKPWGRLKFGHGQPEFSNTGRLTLIAVNCAMTKPTGAVTASDANSPVAIEAIKKFSASVQHMGIIDTDLLNLMALRGLNYLHAVSTYEANVVQFNLNNPTL